MNSRERILAVLNKEMPDRVPRMEIGFHPLIAEQILGKKFEDKSNHLMGGFAPCSDLEVYERDLDLMIELCKEHEILDMLACKYWVPVFPSSGPAHAMDRPALINLMEDFERESKKLPDLSQRDYSCGEILIEKCKKNGIASCLQGHFLIEQVISAFGFANFCMAILDKRYLVETILDFLVEYSGQNLKKLVALKPDFIVIGEDIAYGSGPYISPKDFNELILPRFKKLTDIIDCPWVYHSDGNLIPVIDGLLDLGMNAIHPIEPYGAMDIVDAKQKYGDRVVLAGNLDMNLIANGTPDEVKQQVKLLFDNVGQDGGWILTSSNSIDSGAKPENVVAMTQAVKQCIYYDF